jgi:hypothetical protein
MSKKQHGVKTNICFCTTSRGKAIVKLYSLDNEVEYSSDYEVEYQKRTDFITAKQVVEISMQGATLYGKHGVMGKFLECTMQ